MFPPSYLKQFIGKEIVLVVQITPTAGGEWSGTLLDVVCIAADSDLAPTHIAVIKVTMTNEKTRERFTTEMHIRVGIGMIKIVRSTQSASVAIAR